MPPSIEQIKAAFAAHPRIKVGGAMIIARPDALASKDIYDLESAVYEYALAQAKANFGPIKAFYDKVIPNEYSQDQAIRDLVKKAKDQLADVMFRIWWLHNGLIYINRLWNATKTEVVAVDGMKYKAASITNDADAQKFVAQLKQLAAQAQAKAEQPLKLLVNDDILAKAKAPEPPEGSTAFPSDEGQFMPPSYGRSYGVAAAGGAAAGKIGGGSAASASSAPSPYMPYKAGPLLAEAKVRPGFKGYFTPAEIAAGRRLFNGVDVMMFPTAPFKDASEASRMVEAVNQSRRIAQSLVEEAKKGLAAPIPSGLATAEMLLANVRRTQLATNLKVGQIRASHYASISSAVNELASVKPGDTAKHADIQRGVYQKLLVAQKTLPTVGEKEQVIGEGQIYEPAASAPAAGGVVETDFSAFYSASPVPRPARLTKRRVVDAAFTAAERTNFMGFDVLKFPKKLTSPADVSRMKGLLNIGLSVAQESKAEAEKGLAFVPPKNLTAEGQKLVALRVGQLKANLTVANARIAYYKALLALVEKPDAAAFTKAKAALAMIPAVKGALVMDEMDMTSVQDQYPGTLATSTVPVPPVGGAPPPQQPPASAPPVSAPPVVPPYIPPPLELPPPPPVEAAPPFVPSSDSAPPVEGQYPISTEAPPQPEVLAPVEPVATKKDEPAAAAPADAKAEEGFLAKNSLWIAGGIGALALWMYRDRIFPASGRSE